MFKQVHIISENELDRVKRIGRRIRACCPVHNSRDRDLSIAPYFSEMDESEARLAGYGYCHSIKCGATVLVKEWNPRAAAFYGHSAPAPAPAPRITVLADGMRQAEKWQVKELAALKKIHDTAISMLHHPRALAYLEQRGLAHTLDTLIALRVGYIPPCQEWRSSVPGVLAKWCDRFIFPLTTSEGETGFIGRTLELWAPGMDENKHKALLDAQDKVRRYEKTYKSGLFNASAREQHKHLILCEGAFDAIPLIHEGVSNVVALAGTHIDAKDYPSRVLSVTIAFDVGIDETSEKYLKMREVLGYAGIEYELKTPAQDGQGKDWNERYRRYGRAGLATLLEAGLEQEQEQEVLICSRCGQAQDDTNALNFFYSEAGACYCSAECEALAGAPALEETSQQNFEKVCEDMRELEQEQDPLSLTHIG